MGGCVKIILKRTIAKKFKKYLSLVKKTFYKGFKIVVSNVENIKSNKRCRETLNETNKDFKWSEKEVVHKGLPTFKKYIKSNTSYVKISSGK